MPKFETKTLGGSVVEVKQEDRNGQPVGIIEGYIATWDLDRGDGWYRDQFTKGAFRKSIKDLKNRKRALRFKDHHGRTVGGFPADSLKEDSRGLFGRGEINLNVQQGAEAYALAKQGVLTDFSVGFSSVKSTRDEQNDVRTITEAILWEGSIVDEPMNPEANITSVKTNGGDMPVTEDEVKEFTKRDLEHALRDGNEFTKSAAKMVASLFSGQLTDEEKEVNRIAEEKAAQAVLDKEAEELEAQHKELLDSINEVKTVLRTGDVS